MSRLTRDGTAEPVSRDQILRHARGQGNIIFPVQLTTSRIGNLTRLIHTLLYVMTIHTYIHTYTSIGLKLCVLCCIASREKGTFSSSRKPTEVSRRWTCKTAPKNDVCIVVETVVLLRVRISKHLAGSWAGYYHCVM